MALNELRERVLGTYLVKNVGLLLSATAIGSLFGLGRTALLAQYLSKDSFGVINYVISVQAVVSLVGMPGFNSAVAQYTAKGYPYTWKLSVKRRIPFVAICSLILITLALVSQSKNLELARAFLVAALLLPFAWLLQGVPSYLSGLKRFPELALYRLGEYVTYFLGACAGLFVLGSASAWGVLAAQWLMLDLMSLGFMVRHWRALVVTKIPAHETEHAANMDSFSKYAHTMTYLAAASGIQNWLSPILIGTFVSLPELADYAIGDILYSQMKRIWGAYYQVSTPRLLRLSGGDMRKQVLREQRYVILFWTICCVALATVSAIFMPFIFYGKYASSVPFIIVLLAASWAGTVGGGPQIYFRLKENNKALTLMRSVSVFSAIAFPIAFIQVWGALGIAVGRLLSNIVLSAAGWVLFVRDERISYT